MASVPSTTAEPEPRNGMAWTSVLAALGAMARKSGLARSKFSMNTGFFATVAMPAAAPCTASAPKATWTTPKLSMPMRLRWRTARSAWRWLGGAHVEQSRGPPACEQSPLTGRPPTTDPRTNHGPAPLSPQPLVDRGLWTRGGADSAALHGCRGPGRPEKTFSLNETRPVIDIQIKEPAHVRDRHSLNNFFGAQHQRMKNRETDRLGGLEVDDSRNFVVRSIGSSLADS